MNPNLKTHGRICFRNIPAGRINNWDNEHETVPAYPVTASLSPPHLTVTVPAHLSLPIPPFNWNATGGMKNSNAEETCWKITTQELCTSCDPLNPDTKVVVFNPSLLKMSLQCSRSVPELPGWIHPWEWPKAVNDASGTLLTWHSCFASFQY